MIVVYAVERQVRNQTVLAISPTLDVGDPPAGMPESMFLGLCAYAFEECHGNSPDLIFVFDRMVPMPELIQSMQEGGLSGHPACKTLVVVKGDEII